MIELTYYNIFILLVAGFGAGIITGLIGGSAVIAIASFLVLFSGYPIYDAIGIGLATDIVASIVASYIYIKHGNVKSRPAVVFLVVAVIVTVISSYFSSYAPSIGLEKAMGLAVFIIGIRLITKKKILSKNASKKNSSKARKLFLGVLSGIGVGIVAGAFGAGGGMMMFLILFFVYGYSVHSAIGTSIFFMIFIALFGAIGHAVTGNFTLTEVFISWIGAAAGAVIFAKVSHRLSEEALKKIVGVFFVVLGIMMLVKEVFL